MHLSTASAAKNTAWRLDKAKEGGDFGQAIEKSDGSKWQRGLSRDGKQGIGILIWVLMLGNRRDCEAEVGKGVKDSDPVVLDLAALLILFS